MSTFKIPLSPKPQRFTITLGGVDYLSKPIRAILGTKYTARDFTPPYDPWDQRLCLTPDDDLFMAIKSGKAQIVTDRIVAVDERGIVLQSGKRIDAPVHRDEHGAEAIGDGGRGERREIVGRHCPFGLDVRPVPHADVAPIQPAGDAQAGNLDHVLNRPHDPDRLPERAAECAGHGVGRLRLEVPRELERRSR